MNERESVGGRWDPDALSAGTAEAAAARRLELSVLDAMTLRDLTELGGVPGDAALSTVLAVLFAAVAEGSVCLDLESEAFLRRLPERLRNDAAAALEGFEKGLAAGRYDALAGEDGDAYRPLVLDAGGGRRLLYFQKYFVHERRLAGRVEAFLGAQDRALARESAIDAWIDEIHSGDLAVRVGPNREPLRRDPQQIRAVRLALMRAVTVVSGGPGTGKTSMLVHLLRCLVRAGVAVEDIVLAAPTGRAAQRMTESVRSAVGSIARPAAADRRLAEVSGSTLHRILGYRPRRHEFTHGRTNPLPAGVVVIDEVSMVDVSMMDHLVQAVDPERTRLVLLGDQHQLPSVEAGAVFAEMIPDGASPSRFADRMVVLRKVYRSGARLLSLAERANRGEFPPLRPVSFQTALGQEPDRWAFVRSAGPDRWQDRLQRWVQHAFAAPAATAHGRDGYPSLVAAAGAMQAERLGTSEEGAALLEAIFSVIERARILTLLRVGPYGCEAVNDWIAGHLAPRMDPAVPDRRDGFSGAPVLVTRNDHARELYNGDVGVLIRGPDGLCRAYFRRSGAFADLAVDLLPSWESAFAMTVHKSQGSEFDDVLLVLPDDEDHRLLTREIVYTGITRARKRVILHGTPEALHRALGRKIQRQSGLAW